MLLISGDSMKIYVNHFIGDPKTVNRINELKVKNNQKKRHESTKPPQKVNYYGRNIGRPVKVHPQMREKKQGNQRR